MGIIICSNIKENYSYYSLKYIIHIHSSLTPQVWGSLRLAPIIIIVTYQIIIINFANELCKIIKYLPFSIIIITHKIMSR